MPTPQLAALAARAGVSARKAEELWQEAKAEAEKAGRGDDYAYIVGILKRMLGLNDESEGERSPSDFSFLEGIWGRATARAIHEGRMPASVKSALMMRFLEFERQLRQVPRGQVNWDTLARTLRMAVFTLLNWAAGDSAAAESFKKHAGVV